MKRKWYSRRTPKIDPVELNAIAEKSLKDTRDQQSYVNSLTTYLLNRKGQNGFGEDFDITITYPRGA